MKKRFLALLLLLGLLLSACGGAQPDAADAPSGTAISFTDDLGRTVTVDDPQRTAPLLGSFAQIWTLAGGTVHATADDAWELLPDLPASVMNLGGAKALNLELLLEAAPDFILASVNTSQQVEWLETLEATGIPTAYFDVTTFDDYLRVLSICTDITGRADLLEANGTAVQAQIDSVLAQSRSRLQSSPPPTVLSLAASSSRVRAKNSRGNVLGEMLADLGCVNIADSDEMLLEDLSIERILEADPDYIFIVQHGSDTAGTEEAVRRMMDEHPAWHTLTAVQEGRLFFMDKQLFMLKPAHRWGEAYEQLEAILQS